VEDDSADDYVGALPAVRLNEDAAKRGEEERSDARPADGDSGREGALLVEVEPDHDDGREVHHTEADT